MHKKIHAGHLPLRLRGPTSPFEGIWVDGEFRQCLNSEEYEMGCYDGHAGERVFYVECALVAGRVYREGVKNVV